jgi:hypothetical protein
MKPSRRPSSLQPNTLPLLSGPAQQEQLERRHRGQVYTMVLPVRLATM